MHRVLFAVALVLPSLASPASAQDAEPNPPAAGAEAAAGDVEGPNDLAAPPASAEATPAEPATAADDAAVPDGPADEVASQATSHEGVFAEGGLYLNAVSQTSIGMRGEVGIPLLGGLSLVVPVMFAMDRLKELGFTTRWVDLHFAPGLRYDLDVYSGAGRVSIHGEAGLGVSLARFHKEQWGTGATLASSRGFGIARAAIGATYTAQAGWMVTVQPLGTAVLFGHGGHDFDYEMSILGGYRFP